MFSGAQKGIPMDKTPQPARHYSLRKAALINAASKYTSILCSLLFSMILARILNPSDYGVIAVTTVFTSFFAIFTDIGIGPGIIQNKSLTREDVNGLFAFSLFLSISLGVLFALLSIPMSFMYQDDVYKPVGCILGLGLAFSSLNMVPDALLMKDKRFLLVSIRNVAVPIGTNILALVFAKMGFGLFALVFQALLASLITLIWNLITAKRRYALSFDFRRARQAIEKIRSFSGYQFAFTAVNYFARNMDNLLISRFAGEAALGLYDKAYKLMLYPVNYLTHAVTPVLHPILSDYQNDKEKVLREYMRVVKPLSLLAVFIAPICFYLSGEIIGIMYGDKWLLSAEYFKWLSLAIWPQMVTSSTGSLFQSIGNTRLMFRAGLIAAIVIVSSILIGLSTKSIVILSICVAIAYNLSFLINYSMLMRMGMGRKFLDFAGMLKKDFLIYLMMMILGKGIAMIPFEDRSFSLVISLALFFVGYVLLLWVTKEYPVFLNLLGRSRHRG